MGEFGRSCQARYPWGLCHNISNIWVEQGHKSQVKASQHNPKLAWALDPPPMLPDNCLMVRKKIVTEYNPSNAPNTNKCGLTLLL